MHDFNTDLASPFVMPRISALEQQHYELPVVNQELQVSVQVANKSNQLPGKKVRAATQMDARKRIKPMD